MTEHELHRFLTAQTGRPVKLRINMNTQSLLTAYNGKGRELNVSVHRMFLDAGKEVREALAEFVVRANSHNRRIIREFIAANTHKIATKATRRKANTGTPVGEYYDLAPIAERINRVHFGGKFNFDIVWGKRPSTPPRSMHSITLGLCLAHQKLIRIHPILDSPKVPIYYLEYIIYHEMVHMAVPSRIGANGKLMHHTDDFYALERRYPRYRQALAWQERHLNRLMAAWCRPRPRPARGGQLGFF